MTLLALHNYILHFLLLDANIYHDFNTWLCKTKRQHTAVKSCACFLFYLSIGMQAGCCSDRSSPHSSFAEPPLITTRVGPALGPAPPLCRAKDPAQSSGRTSASVQVSAMHALLSCIFFISVRDVFPSLCSAVVSREGVPIQHTPETGTELLVEMWPAGQPFWWDEMHEMNFLDLWFPQSHLIRQLSNTAGTCSQAVLLSTLRHMWSHRLSSSSFPPFITIAPEIQTSCCLEEPSECRSWK